MSGEIQPKKAPGISIPASKNTCTISIVDTTAKIVVPAHTLVEPQMPGQANLNLPDFGYYIKNDQTGEEILFDAGGRKDWQNCVPAIINVLRTVLPGYSAEKSVHEVLTEGGVNTDNLKAFILSHHHFDHTGNIGLFAKSTDLVVGPGFKEAFNPGYPANENAPFWEEEIEGRKVDEIAFSDDFKIGEYQAYDYLGDGSIYILNVPGHAIGHIAGLVRTTTSPDTFVLLGGDACHITGSLRPNLYSPLPSKIPEESAMDKRIPRGCPCSAFTACHPNPQNSRTSPFYNVSTHENSFYADVPTSEKSIATLIEFDADPNILVSISHDPTPLDVFDFFPKGTINDWKRKGWKEQIHWGFLNELPYNGTIVRPPLLDGLYYEGKRLRDLDFNWAS